MNLIKLSFRDVEKHRNHCPHLKFQTLKKSSCREQVLLNFFFYITNVPLLNIFVGRQPLVPMVFNADESP